MHVKRRPVTLTRAFHLATRHGTEGCAQATSSADDDDFLQFFSFLKLETEFSINWTLTEYQQRLDRLQKQDCYPSKSLQHHDLIDTQTLLVCQLLSYITDAETIL